MTSIQDTVDGATMIYPHESSGQKNSDLPSVSATSSVPLSPGSPALKPHASPLSSDAFAKHAAPFLVELVLEKNAQIEQFDEWFANASSIAESPISFFSSYISKPVKTLDDLLPSEISSTIGIGVDATKIALHIPQSLGEGATLIFKKSLIDEAENYLKMIKSTLVKRRDPGLKQQAEHLEKWIYKHNKTLQKQATKYALKQGLSLPKMIKTVYKMFFSLNKGVNLAYTWLFGLISIIKSIIRVDKTGENARLQKKWMEETTQPPLSSVSAERLLIKRKIAFTKKMDAHRKTFIVWLAQISNEDAPFERLVETLKKRGILLNRFKETEEITSIAEFKDSISDKKIQEIFLKQYVDHLNTISASNRNALKSLELQKQMNMKRALARKSRDSKINLAKNIISTIALTALKTLVFASVITLPPLLLPLAGLGFFFLGLIFTSVGLFALYKHRPNSFRTSFRFIGTRLAFSRLPSTYYQLRYQRKKVQILEGSLKTFQMSAKMAEIDGILTQESIALADLPKGVISKLKKLGIDDLTNAALPIAHRELTKYKKELEKKAAKSIRQQKALEKESEKIKVKVDKWQLRVEELQKIIKGASFRDFARSAHLRKTAQKRNFKVIDEIVGGVMADYEHLDKSTQKLLLERFGIDWQELIKLPTEARIEEHLIKGLQTYFAMDFTAMVKFVKKQRELNPNLESFG